MLMPQTRLTEGPLLDGRGRLAMAGWATAPVRVYDRARIAAPRRRIKEWDYYLISDGSRALALTIDDNAYMGMLSASWLDLGAAAERTVSRINPLPLGRTHLPPSAAAGTCFLKNGRSFGRFVTEDGVRRLRFRMENFSAGAALSADLTLTDPPRDSMVIATPFAEDPRAFYYNQKIVGMRASGTVELGAERYGFAPDRAFALLDWGRGVWTYENTWFWSAAMGELGGETFGFNLGYGFGDTSAASENMIFCGGTAHKLAAVDFGIPQRDGRDDYLSPWHFTSSDGRFEAEFRPTLDRAARTDLRLILSDQHQVFGRFSGRAVLDDGTERLFRDLPGFAEKVHNKW